MPTLFITGAAGGLGREFVRQYREAGWTVIAPARTDMDVTDRASIEAYLAALPHEAVDVLINNAGIRNPEPAASRLGSFSKEAWLPTLTINVIGPALVTQSVLPLLRRGAQRKIVTLSSRLGSFAAGGGSNSGGAGSSYYAYRVSKSAVNQVNRCLSLDLESEGFICTLLDPGWVQTPMGGTGATLTAAESVAKLIAVVSRLSPRDNGKFISLDGAEVPW
jgi:NAD(P)-dependent dehydrogenase (short-subunit alcohol dehydrogenase family)